MTEFVRFVKSSRRFLMNARYGLFYRQNDRGVLHSASFIGRLAQLVRASRLHREGRRFESYSVHQQRLPRRMRGFLYFTVRIVSRAVALAYMHAVLVHGLKGWPDNGWFPWLRKELEARGFTTESLKLPNPLLPDRAAWVRMVRDSIKGPDTVLIGHSLGCAAILLALQEYDGPPVARVVCVSGLGRPYLTGTIMKKMKEWTGWFTSEIDFDAVRPKAKTWTVIHSPDDYIVPFSEGEWLAGQLGVPVIIPKAKGHLIHEERCFELPEALQAVLGEGG